MRKQFIFASIFVVSFIAAAGFFNPLALWFLVPVLPLVSLGVYDMNQKRHAIRRNFPVLGHFRYVFEAIRPEINQYFVESNSNGVPFNREQRSLVYQRSKKVL